MTSAVKTHFRLRELADCGAELYRRLYYLSHGFVPFRTEHYQVEPL